MDLTVTHVMSNLSTKYTFEVCDKVIEDLPPEVLRVMKILSDSPIRQALFVLSYIEGGLRVQEEE